MNCNTKSRHRMLPGTPPRHVAPDELQAVGHVGNASPATWSQVGARAADEHDLTLGLEVGAPNGHGCAPQGVAVRRLHRVHLGETHTHTHTGCTGYPVMDTQHIRAGCPKLALWDTLSSPCRPRGTPPNNRYTPTHTHTHFTDLHVSSPTLICTSRTS